MLIVLVGCNAERGEERILYSVRGEVVRLDAARRSVTIAHEAIPGFMEPMTMPFEVRDPALLQELNIGESVQFELVVQGNHAWISKFIEVGGLRKGE